MGVVSEKFQVVIPPAVRKAAGIKAGLRVRVSASSGVITITPERTGASDPAAGIGMVKAKFHVDIEDRHGGYRRTKVMTGLDTNILIRYDIDEPDADEKTLRQKEIAAAVMLSASRCLWRKQ